MFYARPANFLSAAALLTLASSSLAADLPMTKAEPVEYVKICSEFGEGFYYIPGTDTCLSINGYVRADYWWFEPDSRADDGLSFRGRGRVNFDARTATEWGTLRSFVSFEYNRSHPTGNGVRADKAFIQFGGWTAGYATSFYDFYDAEAGNTLYGTYFSSSKTTHLLAYTATFGNGFAATLSLEDNYYRREGIMSPRDYFFSLAGVPLIPDEPDYYGGQRAPDVVAALRWTQDWGSAQIMAALHENRSDLSASFFAPQVGVTPGIFNDERWGWAVSAGVIFNLPSGFFFALEGNYARGAASYAGLGDGKPGNDVVDALTSYFPLAGVTLAADDFDLELSRAWSVTADLGYNFTPSLVGHIVASYARYQGPQGFDIGTPFFVGPAGLIGDIDFDTWSVTANLTYTITKGLTIAGEVSHEKRDYELASLGFVTGAQLLKTTDIDYSTWAAGIRLKRSF